MDAIDLVLVCALMLRPAQPLHARAAPPHSDMVRACGGRQETVCSLRFAAKVNSCETAARGGARRNVQGAPDADAAAVRAACSGLCLYAVPV